MSKEQGIYYSCSKWHIGVDTPNPSQNIAHCKWIFIIKRKPDGNIEQYKARLVAKSFHQHSGLDFTEKFIPMVKTIIIRMVLYLAFTLG